MGRGNLMHSIFFDFERPNPTTWLYFSIILVVAMFFRFSRVFSLRNFDLISLYVPMPGFLFLLESQNKGGAGTIAGYAWLVASSVYFVIRCLVDLGLERRPPHFSNLNPAGISWMSFALFVSLVGITLIPPPENSIDPGVSKFPVEKIRAQGDAAIREQARESHTKVRMWTERGLSLGCHMAIVVGLVMVSWRHFDDWQPGMAAAACHLVLPYSFLLTPHNELGIGRWEDTWPMALILWSIFFLSSPLISGVLMGIAVGSLLFPFFIVPSWLGLYRGGERYRFLAGFLTVIFGALVVVLASGLVDSWLLSPDWLPWKQPTSGSESVWNAVPWAWAYRLPVFLIHLVLFFLAGFWPQPRNVGHLIAQCTMLLAATQWWTADQGGAHVLWFLPLFLLLVFRPALRNQYAVKDFFEAEKVVLARLQEWWKKRQERHARNLG